MKYFIFKVSTSPPSSLISWDNVSLALITTGARSISFLQSIQLLLGWFPFLYGPPSLDGGTLMLKAVVGKKGHKRDSSDSAKTRERDEAIICTIKWVNGHRAQSRTGLIIRRGKTNSISSAERLREGGGDNCAWESQKGPQSESHCHREARGTIM